jgi:hypothetical protein
MRRLRHYLLCGSRAAARASARFALLGARNIAQILRHAQNRDSIRIFGTSIIARRHRIAALRRPRARSQLLYQDAGRARNRR